MTEEMCIAWLQGNIFVPSDCFFYCKPYCSKEQTDFCCLLCSSLLFLKVSLISSRKHLQIADAFNFMTPARFGGLGIKLYLLRYRGEKRTRNASGNRTEACACERWTHPEHHYAGSTCVLYYVSIYFRGSHMHSYFVLFSIKLLTIQISFIKCKGF